ncbi:MAG: hypothetical protein ABI760_24605 [Ferruginibacter sp.]
MLDTLRAWLNGTREYNLGASLYFQLGENNDLKAIFNKGFSPYCYKRLQAELLKICISLKSEMNPGHINEKPKPAHIIDEETTISKNTVLKDPTETTDNNYPPPENANSELYTACKLEADNTYKQAMNHRAVLFSMVPSELYEDPNRPDLVEQRSKLCIRVVNLYNQASDLYDKADFVRINGILPEVAKNTIDEIDNIPDHLVKSKLDNLRKNYNKTKKREQTPERISLLQKHQSDILKLEKRWLSLKPNQ